MAASSRSLVDPELLPLLELLPAKRLSLDSLAELRSMAAVAPPFFAPPASEVTTQAHLAPGPEGAPDVPVSTFRPCASKDALPCILHIHGGGYVMGAASAYAPRHMAMCVELDCVIVAVDYRLAPETCAPGPLEDCYAALSWLFQEADRLGVERSRIGVMGESAGGGLAAALALLARDRGDHQLAFQHLFYPMLDDRTCVEPEAHPLTGEFVWTAADNHFGWSAYLGHEPGGADVSPYAVPGRAASLEGLPPAFVSTGALDLFLEEDVRYALRLSRSGVPTELHVYPGGFHGFDFHPTAAVSATARRDSLAALARALRPTTS